VIDGIASSSTATYQSIQWDDDFEDDTQLFDTKIGESR